MAKNWREKKWHGLGCKNELRQLAWLLTNVHKLVNYTASALTVAKQACIILPCIYISKETNNQCLLNEKSVPPPCLNCLDIESVAIPHVKVKSDLYQQDGVSSLPEANMCCPISYRIEWGAKSCVTAPWHIIGQWVFPLRAPGSPWDQCSSAIIKAATSVPSEKLSPCSAFWFLYGSLISLISTSSLFLHISSCYVNESYSEHIFCVSPIVCQAL